MTAAEIIRNMLDLFDDPRTSNSAEAESENPVVITIQKTSIPDVNNDTEAMARYRQIVDLLPNDLQNKEFANTLDEKYADIDSVIATGTDLNKSKHPADIRTNAPSLYPGAQWQGE